MEKFKVQRKKVFLTLEEAEACTEFQRKWGSKFISQSTKRKNLSLFKEEFGYVGGKLKMDAKVT